MSGLDSTGRFHLVGVPSGPIQLQFKGQGIEASLTLTVAEGERIELTVRVTNSGVRIEAERREPGGRDGARIGGLISEIDATARTVTFQVLVGQNCGYNSLAPGIPEE